MATPRKHYFRVADSILRETWDDSTLATLVRLMAYMNQRWARDGLTAEEASTIRLRLVDLLPLVNRTRQDAARAVLRSCAAAVAMTVTELSGIVTISWPKFSEFQGYASPTSAPKHTPSASASASAPATKSRTRSARAASPPAPPPEWALGQAESLRESVRRRWPGAPVPESLIGWARELSKIKALPSAVCDLLAWYTAPSRDATQYLPECRSGRSFREKYDAVLAARKRVAPTPPVVKAPAPWKPPPQEGEVVRIQPGMLTNILKRVEA